jgi:choline-sulfatase
MTLSRIRHAAATGCALLATSLICNSPAHTASLPADEHPNVLLVITDQQHAGMMSCAGNPWVKTPAMDALAARGVRFERAYCGNPVCVPSRFTMMTGVLPSRIGMDRNGPASLPVADELLHNSLGHVFRRAGYQTVYGGKVHLPATRGKGIAAYGFDALTGDEREGLAKVCSEFLQQEHDKPFLMVASFINPHDICYMAIDAFTQARSKTTMYPKSVRERKCLAEAMRLPAGISRDEFFAKVCPPLPDNFEIPANEPAQVRGTDWRGFRPYVQQYWSEQDWRLHRWAYARLTERVDLHIGHVLDSLRAAGLERNTLVVFTSDHGDMDAAHRLEHKSMPYEEAIRVPLIVSLPGVTLEGKVAQTQLVSSGLDLIPTLCDFAGIETPGNRPGRSLRPLTVKPSTAEPWRDSLVVENEGSRILLTQNYKYAVYKGGEPREMLIDRTNDPGEMTNLATDPQHAPIVTQHRRLLRRWYRVNGETLDQEYHDVQDLGDDAGRDRLRPDRLADR